MRRKFKKAFLKDLSELFISHDYMLYNSDTAYLNPSICSTKGVDFHEYFEQLGFELMSFEEGKFKS